MYKSERRSKKAARTFVFVVIGLFVALASTAVIALVMVMSSEAEAHEPAYRVASCDCRMPAAQAIPQLKRLSQG